MDQTELRERASIIINQDVNNEGTDGSESGRRDGEGRARENTGCTIESRLVASVVASPRPWYARAGEPRTAMRRIVTGINASRPRDRSLSLSLSPRAPPTPRQGLISYCMRIGRLMRLMPRAKSINFHE